MAKLTASKRRWIARGLKVLAFTVNILFPAWAVMDKFPVWKEERGLLASLGVGALIIGVIVAWTARNALAAWVKRMLGDFAYAQSAFWLGGVVILLILNAVAGLVADLLTVWIAGTAGMLAGTAILWAAKRVSGGAENGTDG